MAGQEAESHVRVWRREGWPPVVLVGIPRDESRASPWVTHDLLLPEVRERWLPDDDVVSFWLYMPIERTWIDKEVPDRVHREYIEVTPSPRRARPGKKKRQTESTQWLPKTRAEFEKVIGDVAEVIPPGLYRRDVVERVIAAEGKPVDVVWDRYGVAGLVGACLVLDDASKRPGPDRDLLRAAAFHEANHARAIHQGNLEDTPDSTPWVTVVPIDFPKSTWARVDALDAASPPYVEGEYRPWVIDLKRNLRALLKEKGDSMAWAVKEAVEHASHLSPIDERPS